MAELLINENKSVRTFLVKDSEWGKTVIKKVFDSDHFTNDEYVRFHHEYDLLDRIEINGIRKGLKKAIENGRPVAYFEYFEGFTVKQIIASGKIVPADVVRLMISITDTLITLHDIRLVHKNINSNNLLINPDTTEIQIIDFSYANRINEKKHQLGNPDLLDGNLAYISPEQTGRMNRQIDIRSDLYSLGVVMFEMLSGRLPFITNDSLELIHSHLAKQPPDIKSIRPEIPGILDQIVRKLLAKNPEERYQSARGLQIDLKKCLQHYQKHKKFPEFEPGKQDISPILHISQKLYGRHKEINILRDLFHQVIGNPAQIVMINGYSGVGKTVVVHEVFSDISRKNGYFIKGKFDQLQRNIPYFALANAFKEYVNYVITEEPGEIEKVKRAILEAVDKEAWLLTEIIPSLEMILGKQEQGEVLAGMEAQNRLNYVFGNFLKSISRSENPLVLFIDDLQWADSSSLNLLYNLLRDDKLENLLFIGSYRSNEVKEAHPLTSLLNKLNDEKGSVFDLRLNNLSLKDIKNLLTDSLQLKISEVTDLSEIIYNKTHGNAFHVVQVIKLMYETGVLHLDSSQLKWSWSSDKVRNLELSENVIDLLAVGLERLDKRNLRILQSASCIGNSFKKEYLEIIEPDDRELVTESLEIAQQEGYIYSERESYYFIHDRIQQTVYSFLGKDQKAALHLRIGEFLLKNYRNDPAENIFDIVNQLNAGISLIKDRNKKIEYGLLNLKAGQKARSSSAFNSAFEYAGFGIRLLDDNWNENRQLLMDLHILAAESAYLIGNFEEVDALLNPVLKHGKNILKIIPAYEIRIEALKAQNKLLEAIGQGISTLKLLNIDLTDRPTRWKIIMKMLKVRMTLLGKKTDKLRNLPDMTNEYKLAAMRILVAIGPAVYWGAPDLIPHTIFEMVLLSVRYGNTNESVFAYSTYALFLSGVTVELSAGNKFGNLALFLANRSNMKNRVKGVFNVFCFVDHWTNPIRESLPRFEENFKLGLEAGDLEFSALSAYLFCNHHYYVGTGLVDLNKIMSVYSNEIKLIKQHTPLNYLLIHWQALKNLRGETSDPLVLSGEVYDEKIKIDQHISANDRTALFKFYLQKMILYCYFERYEEAVRFGNEGINYIQAATGMLVTAIFWFYYGIVNANVSESPNKKNLETLEKAIRNFRKWSKHSPDNHKNKYELLLAEYHRLRSDLEQARIHYDKAINLSVKNGLIQESAIANFLAGKSYIVSGNAELGQFYLINAYIQFKKWGADAVCNELRFKYSLDNSIGYYFKHLNPSFQLTQQRNSFENVDFRSIIKASTAITSEIEYDQLIRNLLRVLIENSGAQSGSFISVNNNKLKVEGQWPEPADGLYRMFPEKIVQWVLQTGEVVNLPNAMDDPRWNQDSYITGNKVKSLLCFPVKYQAETGGVIFIENNITYGTFTEEREELMQLLSGQIAIAIRNASLYKDLENTLKEQIELKEAYSRFIPKEILQFLGKDSILDIRLGDQIQENVSIMFMDIMDYTQLSETMSPRDNFNFINGYLKRVGPHIERHGGFICQFLGDGFMAIFKEKPDLALQSAIYVQQEIIAYNKQRRKNNRKSIQVGIGLHHGPVMLGIIGDHLRMDQNVISDHVNIASRIQGLTRFYGANIIISSLLLDKIENPDDYHFRKLGKVVLKGKKEEIEVIECIEGLSRPDIKARLNNLQFFEKGMEAYYAMNFSGAAVNFEKVLKDNPQDKAARYYLNKAAMFISEGIPKGWTGIEVMDSK